MHLLMIFVYLVHLFKVLQHSFFASMNTFIQYIVVCILCDANTTIYKSIYIYTNIYIIYLYVE